MKHILSLLMVALLLGFYACTDLDRFSTNPDHRLSFSSDTVGFDTVFSTIGSSTRRLMIYNRNNEPLKITSIRLEGGNNGFYLNIDGSKGASFDNVFIRANDSLFAFVEVNVNPTNVNSPLLIRDSITFVTNNTQQRILLLAYGQDAVIWKGRRIDADTTLTGEKPLLIYDSLFVAPNATLTTEKGTKLFFHDKARMEIHGRWSSKGTIEEPVVLRGDRTDRLFSDLPYDLISGQWGGVIFTKESYENTLTNTIIRNSNFGIVVDSSDVNRQKLMIDGCQITNSAGELFYSTHSWIEAINSEFTNSGGYLCGLFGGKYKFTHCTFANYYKFGAASQPTLYLQNYNRDLNGQVYPLPLVQAEFNNCIIDGQSSTEVGLHDASKELNQPTPFAHRFDHCLIKAKGSDDESFISTVWDTNAGFRNTAKEGYAFDFRPDSLSKARNAGEERYTIQLPFDRYGISRPSTSPDIGCYQWTENPK